MYRDEEMKGAVEHSGQTGKDSDREQEISRKQLVNRLNYLNFCDGTILVNLRHPLYDHTLTLPARPQPCLGGSLECRWDEPHDLPEDLAAYRLKNFLITDEKKLLLVRPRLLRIDGQGASFSLPDACSEIHLRSSKRHPCRGIKAQLMQNGAIFHGQLINFTPASFQVEVTAEPPQTFLWINPDSSAVVVLSDDRQMLYTGPCRFLKKTPGQQACELLLAPMATRIQRFKPKQYRSSRRQLQPSPNAMFCHPLTGKRIDLKVHDLSGAGFSLLETKALTQLLSGLVIPRLELVFADGLRMTCQAQVVYQRPFSVAGRSMTLSGLAFLDMDQADHVRLMAILQQDWDENAYLCNRVDPEKLWKFFFETGFIYPQKYAGIQSRKEEFRATFQKLYAGSPALARHFIYQENDAILGHMAMLRIYSNSWLIHHHAALKDEVKRAGLAVLRQVGRQINDAHGLCSAHMDYVMCYFQPENRFPKRLFGGVADHYRDPKSCSLDTFAYFRFLQNFDRPWNLSAPWSLTRTETQDLLEVQSFYEQKSGGLMLRALDLTPGSLDNTTLHEEFGKLGLRRDRQVFSLKKNGALKALILVNLSDPGLDFSSLANSMTVIVVDQDDLPRETLTLMLALLSVKFELEEPPVMLFPREYAEHTQLAYEKSYQLWVLNCHETDPYFEYCEKVLKTI